MDETIIRQLEKTKQAKKFMLTCEKTKKEAALTAIAAALKANTDVIVAENEKDVAMAGQNGISEAMVDRLLLTPERITAIANDVLKVRDLPDPINEVIRVIERPNGLVIKQVRIPIGTVGVIYESRPNVTVDISAICIKTNNVAVLKGGKEALNSNRILVKVINDAIKDILGDGCVELIETSDRDQIARLMQANDYLDVIIPRGSAALIQAVVKNASVPVIETGAGICHLYIDSEADLTMALEIALNGKVQRPSVCNAIETILVNEAVAEEFVPKLAKAFKPYNVTIYGDERVQGLIDAKLATAKNYATEYDDYICNIKTVKDVNEAIEHIYQYSTKHSEAIVTRNDATAEYFLSALDSACVYHNASTRFSDGGEFGFGSEVGISTQKLHARGPLGLQEMTSSKYKVYGKGQVRK